MKPRHAAAALLCGWYLMMPPHTDQAGQPPSSSWRIMNIFDSAIQCKDARIKWERDNIEIVEQNLKHYGHLQDGDKQQLANGQAAQCIASDDPRLREK